MKHIVKTIARSQHCKIDRCSCGAVHLSVGSTTVRIKDAAARELRDLLTTALAEIDRQAQAEAPRIHLVDGSGEDEGGPKIH